MSANFNTILVLGATSGIGEGIARRYYAQGKKVIAAGRRLERLNALKGEMPGLETIQFDITDFPNLPKKVDEIFTVFPDLDTVFVCAGIQIPPLDFKNAPPSADDSIATEITTNITAPVLLARALTPHLLALEKTSSLLFVTSGLGFVPIPILPVYCATKSALHSFAVSLRAQFADTTVNVIEISPPYVDTELDIQFRDTLITLQGGEDKAIKPMPLGEYLDTVMEGLAEVHEGKPKSIVATGFSQRGADAWTNAFRPMLQHFGITA